MHSRWLFYCLDKIRSPRCSFDLPNHLPNLNQRIPSISLNSLLVDIVAHTILFLADNVKSSGSDQIHTLRLDWLHIPHQVSYGLCILRILQLNDKALCQPFLHCLLVSWLHLVYRLVFLRDCKTLICIFSEERQYSVLEKV